MREEIVCAGFGGQGIMLMGKLLAQAALIEGKKVTWMPSYGAEARGGTAHSMVIISDREIASPIVSRPTTCFVMNSPSLERFGPKVKGGGLLVVNSSLVKRKFARTGIEILRLPFSETAAHLGNVKVANVVALGVYVAKRKVFGLKSLLLSIRRLMAGHKSKLLLLNERALKEGRKLVDG